METKESLMYESDVLQARMDAMVRLTEQLGQEEAMIEELRSHIAREYDRLSERQSALKHQIFQLEESE